MTNSKMRWSVTVSLDGTDVVTISDNHISGPEYPNIEAIRTAAHHLLAFIGDPSPVNPEEVS